MNTTTYVGIDVSKLTLDFCIYDKISKHFIRMDNTPQAIEQLFSTDVVLKTLRKSKTFFCIEDTGFYKNPLVEFLKKKKYRFSVPSALHIKYSMGLARGKTDKLDAERIAVFASKNETELMQWVPVRRVIERLQALMRLRKKIKTMRLMLHAPLKERKAFQDKEMQLFISSHCANVAKAIDTTIAQIEADIQTAIQSDETLKHLYKIVSSVRGVGPVLTNTLIVVTNEFKKFPGPSQFATYAGIAPFERSSGTSLNKKPRVSWMGNGEIKSLLHIAAMSSIRYGEYKAYYQRKVRENKPKMLVLNAVRNKIIKRIFCCVRENRLYEERWKKK